MYSANGVTRVLNVADSSQPPDIVSEAGTPNVGAFGWTSNDLVHLKDLVGWVQVAVESANASQGSAQFAADVLTHVQQQASAVDATVTDINNIRDNIYSISLKIDSQISDFDPKYQVFVTNYSDFSGNYTDFNVKYADFIAKWEEGGGEIDLTAYVRKENNLSDLFNTATARANLQLDRFIQPFSIETNIWADDAKSHRFVISNSGNWGFVRQSDSQWIPLSIGQGGTGAIDLNQARVNLSVDRFNQSDNDLTSVYANSGKTVRFSISSGGGWGLWSEVDSKWLPLGVAMGGTGANSLLELKNNMGLGTITSHPDYTILTGPVNRESDRGSRMVLYANGLIGFQTYQGINITLPISAIPVGGAVSMGPDGRPDGSILEHGNNANGKYTKFADGTMICWFVNTTSTPVIAASGYLYRSATQTMTFPAAFVSPPSVSPIANRVDLQEITWGTAYNPTTTGVNINGFSGAATNTYLGYIAIGRWV